jgi:hypothetical protein
MGPNVDTNFYRDLDYVKKNIIPGCVVTMVDRRTMSTHFHQDKTFKIIKLYKDHALCIDNNGLMESFDYFDIAKAYEHGQFYFT